MSLERKKVSTRKSLRFARDFIEEFRPRSALGSEGAMVGLIGDTLAITGILMWYLDRGITTGIVINRQALLIAGLAFLTGQLTARTVNASRHTIANFQRRELASKAGLDRYTYFINDVGGGTPSVRKQKHDKFAAEGR